MEEEEVSRSWGPGHARSGALEDRNPQRGVSSSMIESGVDTGFIISMVHHMIQ